MPEDTIIMNALISFNSGFRSYIKRAGGRMEASILRMGLTLNATLAAYDRLEQISRTGANCHNCHT